MENQKLTLLQQLSQETQFITLSQLLEKLGEKFAERSVRRWLADLIKVGLVEKVGVKRASKYRILQRSEETTKTLRSFFSEESLIVVEQLGWPHYARCLYEATERSMKIDEVRVRFRQQRRGLSREIILRKLIGEPLEAYIQQSSQMIGEDKRSDFIDDVREDLQELDVSRLACLGVTSEDLFAWKALQNEE